MASKNDISQGYRDKLKVLQRHMGGVEEYSDCKNQEWRYQK